MTAEAFRARRRQKFLTEQYFELNLLHLGDNNEADREGTIIRQARGSLEPVGQGGIFKDGLNLLKLHYTAGCAIDELRPLFAEVIGALAEWNNAYRIYIKSLDDTGDELRTDGTPLQFEELFYFQMAVEVVGLGARRAFPPTPSGRRLGQLRQFKQTLTA